MSDAHDMIVFIPKKQFTSHWPESFYYFFTTCVSE